jgi:hypothetical protein
MIVPYCLLSFFVMTLGAGDGFTSMIDFTTFFFFFFALSDADRMDLLTHASAVRDVGSQA